MVPNLNRNICGSLMLLSWLIAGITPVCAQTAIISDNVKAPNIQSNDCPKTREEALNAPFVASFPRLWYDGAESDGSYTTELGVFTATKFVSDLRNRPNMGEHGQIAFAPANQTFYYLKTLWTKSGGLDRRSIALMSYEVGKGKESKLTEGFSQSNVFSGLTLDTKRKRVLLAGQTPTSEILYSFDLTSRKLSRVYDSNISFGLSTTALAYSPSTDELFALRNAPGPIPETMESNTNSANSNLRIYTIDTLSLDDGKLIASKNIGIIPLTHDMTSLGKYVVLLTKTVVPTARNLDDPRAIPVYKREGNEYLKRKSYLVLPKSGQVLATNIIELPELKCEDTGKDYATMNSH